MNNNSLRFGSFSDGTSEVIPDDSEEYDALNFETFGDNTSDVSDWEVGHEHYVSECEGIPLDIGARGAENEEKHSPQGAFFSGDKKIITVQEIESQLKGKLVINVKDTVPHQRRVSEATMVQERPQETLPMHRVRNFNRGGRRPTRYMGPTFENRSQLDQERFSHPAHRGMFMPPGHTLQQHAGPRNNPHSYHDRIYPMFHPGHIGAHHQEFLMVPNQQQNVFNLPSPGPPLDEYAGLMRPQEKQWLASIQMMQLHTNQPFLDDYYYIMYNQRHQGHLSRKTNNKNLPNTRVVTYSSQPTRYVPLQFENSLGKLQVGSVTAPRKIIDMVVPCNNTETTVKHVDRKSKEILFEIEQLFGIVLKMEETSHNTFLNSESPGEEEPNLQSLQNTILKTLLKRDKLVSIMAIRKGKKVVLRLLPILDNPAQLVHQLLVDLMAIARKDVEQLLLSFLPSIRTYLSSVDLATIVRIVKQYDTEFLLSTKFTTSVIATMIDRAAQVLHKCDDEDIIQEWKQTMLRLILSIEQCTSNERAVIAVDKDLLQEQLNLVQGLFDQELADKLIRVISYQTHSVHSNGHK